MIWAVWFDERVIRPIEIEDSGQVQAHTCGHIASVPLSLKEAIPMLIQALTPAHMGYMELTLFERVP